MQIVYKPRGGVLLASWVSVERRFEENGAGAFPEVGRKKVYF
jgi:hypothetical protein